MSHWGLTKERYFLDKIYIFDYYYNRVFFKNMLIFTSLFVIVYFFSLFLSALPDLMRKSSYNDFITPKNILRYYMYLIPDYINNTISFSYLFTMSYTLGVFYNQQEILALVASGVSTLRVSLISLSAALLVSIFLLVANCFFFPYWLGKADIYNKKLNLTQNERYINNIQARDTNGFLYFGQYFLEDENTLQDFLIIKENFKCSDFNIQKDFQWKNLDNSSLEVINRELFKNQKDIPTCFPFDWYIRGDKLFMDKKTHIWSATDFIKTEFDTTQGKLKSMNIINETQELTEITILPEFFKQEKKSINVLTLKESFYQLEQLRSHSEPIYEFQIDLFDKKILQPFHVIFLAMFSATLGKFFSRRHVFIFSLVFSFTVAFLFLILVNIGYSLAKSKVLPVFAGLGFGYFCGFLIFIYLYRKQMS